MTLRYMSDLRNDYVSLVRWLIREGDVVETRGLVTRELTGVTLEFPHGPRRTMLPIGVNRGVNLKLAAIEALQLLSGLYRHDLVERAAPGFNNVFVDPGDPGYGAYGPRASSQLTNVLYLLRNDPGTRRAVVSIWQAGDLIHDGDRPCTLSLQFLLRRGALELHATMRSQDVWLGLTYDAFMFTQVQHSLANALGVYVGKYVHHVGSMHIYESDVQRARQLETTAEPHVNLPSGIRGMTADVEPFDVAHRLLENDASAHEVNDNRWYAEQIGKLYD